MIRRPPRSTLSLHDALPIFEQALESGRVGNRDCDYAVAFTRRGGKFESGRDEGLDIQLQAAQIAEVEDRKSTRLNSSHRTISYAVFCLKKKKKNKTKICKIT